MPIVWKDLSYHRDGPTTPLRGVFIRPGLVPFMFPLTGNNSIITNTAQTWSVGVKTLDPAVVTNGYGIIPGCGTNVSIEADNGGQTDFSGTCLVEGWDIHDRFWSEVVTVTGEDATPGPAKNARERTVNVFTRITKIEVLTASNPALEFSAETKASQPGTTVKPRFGLPFLLTDPNDLIGIVGPKRLGTIDYVGGAELIQFDNVRGWIETADSTTWNMNSPASVGSYLILRPNAEINF